jgi:hypothetical protein
MRAAMRRCTHEISVARIGKNADGRSLSQIPVCPARTVWNACLNSLDSV